MVFDCYIPSFPELFPERFPELFPEPAPHIGLAFQRSTDNDEHSYYLDIDKELYLVNFGLGHRKDVLITVNKDSMLVEPLTFDIPYEAQKAIENHLLTNEQQRLSSQIVRRYVTNEDFTARISSYGVSPENLFDGEPVNRIQKIVRLSGNEIQHVKTIFLNQNYPNPFNSQTTISYTLPSGGPAMLEVYNILGQRKMLIDRGFEEAGHHAVRVDASHLASGMYLYRLRGRTLSQTRRFTLIK